MEALGKLERYCRTVAAKMTGMGQSGHFFFCLPTSTLLPHIIEVGKAAFPCSGKQPRGRTVDYQNDTAMSGCSIILGSSTSLSGFAGTAMAKLLWNRPQLSLNQVPHSRFSEREARWGCTSSGVPQVLTPQDSPLQVEDPA